MRGVFNLRPYQRKFFDLDVCIAIALWFRQGGKDFTAGGMAVDNAWKTHKPWYIISLTQRQADATFAKCREFSKAYKAATRLSGIVRESESDEYIDYDQHIDHAFRCRGRTLHLPGGGSITSLPGRSPDTLAGLTGNIIFTEFGLFPAGGYEHWRTIFPLITSGVYMIRIISTPRGRNTKLYDLITDPQYTTQKVDIYQGVKDGLVLYGQNGQPCTIDEFKALYKDPVGWRREYLLEFTGDLESLLKWHVLASATADEPVEIIRIEEEGYHPGLIAKLARRYAGMSGRLECGYDVARHHDLACIWCNWYTPSRPRALAILIIMQNVSFAVQRAIVSEIMDTLQTAVGAGDATGLGMDTNETLEGRYGRRWKACTFTAAFKTELGSRLRTAFDDGDQRIPAASGDTKFVAADLYSIQADASGQRLKLTEQQNDLELNSHCDIAYACGLARTAAELSGVTPGVL